MYRPLIAAALLLLASAPGRAQTPLWPSSPAPPEPPQAIPFPQQPAPQAQMPPAAAFPNPAASAPEEPAVDRVFCNQTVDFTLARRGDVAGPYRQFIGIFSDAAWTPQLCAALVVENVSPDGRATIIYAFGPMDSNPSVHGGVLNGTGIIRGGELKFQNSDGSLYSFRPFYSDLEGHWLTPQGQAYEAIFKRTF